MASKFQNKVIADLKKDGWLVIKLIRAGENGFPDLFSFKNSVVKIREVKEGDDSLSPLQRRRIDQLIAQGFDAACIHETKGQIYP